MNFFGKMFACANLTIFLTSLISLSFFDGCAVFNAIIMQWISWFLSESVCRLVQYCIVSDVLSWTAYKFYSCYVTNAEYVISSLSGMLKEIEQSCGRLLRGVADKWRKCFACLLFSQKGVIQLFVDVIRRVTRLRVIYRVLKECGSGYFLWLSTLI